MARGKLLSDVEKGQIIALRKESWSLRAIAKELNRSVGAVQNFVKRPHKTHKPKSTRNAKKITRRQTALLIREACKGQLSARQLQATLGLPVGVRRVQQLLKATPHLQYKKMMQQPKMLQRHKTARLLWAKEQLKQGQEYWKRVVFSDEKRFSLDGPDGLCGYWHDLRTEPRVFSTRNHGGGSIMIWGAISFYGLSIMVTVEGNMNSEGYCRYLEDYLLPFAAETLGDNWVFQQDGAACHRSKYTMQWLDSKGVDVLAWPAKSPDLNIIENVWGHLARAVYGSGRQFETTFELEQEVRKRWNEISEEYIENLYNSITRRLVKVIEKKGDATGY